MDEKNAYHIELSFEDDCDHQEESFNEEEEGFDEDIFLDDMEDQDISGDEEQVLADEFYFK